MEVEAGWVSPYLLGGLGAKTYDFDVAETETDFQRNIGAGLEYRLPHQRQWGLVLEVRDFISTFEVGPVDNTQHDIVWTGGIRLNF